MKYLKLSFLGAAFLLLLLATYYFYPEKALPAGTVVDKLVVYKSKRELLAYAGGNLVKTYSIALGRQPIGHKEYEGDCKTPEGIYTVHDKNPQSAYHRNLGISYPNTQDTENAKSLGKPAGGDIKIHGLGPKKAYIGKFHRWADWTLGCIAVTNQEAEELYEAVKIGAVIEIKP